MHQDNEEAKHICTQLYSRHVRQIRYEQEFVDGKNLLVLEQVRTETIREALTSNQDRCI